MSTLKRRSLAFGAGVPVSSAPSPATAAPPKPTGSYLTLALPSLRFCVWADEPASMHLALARLSVTDPFKTSAYIHAVRLTSACSVTARVFRTVCVCGGKCCSLVTSSASGGCCWPSAPRATAAEPFAIACVPLRFVGQFLSIKKAQ